jgi:hypothetical protein
VRPGVQSTGAAVFRVKGSFPAAFSMPLLSTTLAHREIRRQLCAKELPPESTPGLFWGGPCGGRVKHFHSPSEPSLKRILRLASTAAWATSSLSLRVSYSGE